jgi:hypothetical protein
MPASTTTHLELRHRPQTRGQVNVYLGTKVRLNINVTSQRATAAHTTVLGEKQEQVPDYEALPSLKFPASTS